MKTVEKLTHFQVLVLDLIGSSANGEITGLSLRRELSHHGHPRSGPGFYQAMSRLENSGLVQGRYETKKFPDGQVLRERHYKLTGNGRRTLVDVLQFYQERLRNKAGFGLDDLPSHA